MTLPLFFQCNSNNLSEFFAQASLHALNAFFVTAEADSNAIAAFWEAFVIVDVAAAVDKDFDILETIDSECD